MELPWGATKDDLKKCKTVIYELTGKYVANEIALDLLNIVYAKGGNYSEKTLRAFAEAYAKIFEKEAEWKAGINEEWNSI